MSSRRTLILIAAVAVGAVSAFLVFSYVRDADDRAQGRARRVPVLVVDRDIPRGLTGREALQGGYVRVGEIQSEFKPATAIDDRTLVDNDKVAVAPLAAGQVIVQGMFAEAIDSQTTFAGRVPDDCGPPDPVTGELEPCVAITISVDQVRGVAGVIVPGDLINILVLPSGDLCEETTADGAPAGTTAVLCSPARTLYQAVRVLFVDRQAVPLPGEPTDGGADSAALNTGLITLAVPAQASQVIASVDPGQIYLTLLPQGYTPEPMPVPDPNLAVLPGEDGTVLTPYGPNGIQRQ